MTGVELVVELVVVGCSPSAQEGTESVIDLPVVRVCRWWGHDGM
jgi:hypothetical protein